MLRVSYFEFIACGFTERSAPVLSVGYPVRARNVVSCAVLHDANPQAGREIFFIIFQGEFGCVLAKLRADFFATQRNRKNGDSPSEAKPRCLRVRVNTLPGLVLSVLRLTKPRGGDRLCVIRLRRAFEERSKQPRATDAGLSRQLRERGKGRVSLARTCLFQACPPPAGSHLAGLPLNKVCARHRARGPLTQGPTVACHHQYG